MSNSNYAVLSNELEWYLMSAFVQKRLEANIKMLGHLSFPNSSGMSLGSTVGSMYSVVVNTIKDNLGYSSAIKIDDFCKYVDKGFIANEPRDMRDVVIQTGQPSLSMAISFSLLKSRASLITQGYGYVAVHPKSTYVTIVNQIFKNAVDVIQPRIAEAIAKIRGISETEFDLRDYDSREYIVYVTRSRAHLQEQIMYLERFLESINTEDLDTKLDFIEATLQTLSASKADQPYNIPWANTSSKMFNLPVSFLSAWSREIVENGFVSQEWSIWDDELRDSVVFKAKYSIPRCTDIRNGWGNNKSEAIPVTYGHNEETALGIAGIIETELKSSAANLLAMSASENSVKLNNELKLAVDKLEVIAREFTIYELLSKMFVQQTQIAQLHHRLVGGAQILAGGSMY